MLSVSLVLFIVAVTVLCFLSLYGMAFAFFALTFWLSRNPATDPIQEENPNPGDPVVILIPVHREGESVLDTLETLIHQDYPGTLEIRVLFDSRQDSTFRLLKDKYGLKSRTGSDTLSGGPSHREIYLIETGFRPKRKKLNSQLASLEVKFVAILDADHCAAPDWISTSIKILRAQPHSLAVQSRRKPLSVANLCQLWDSVQGHVGNEVINQVLSKSGKNVMFTGTTCVFRASVFKKRVFPDCVTEDTYLSYSLILSNIGGNNGKGRHCKILYNPNSGSYEQLSPNFKSYVSRRRRWSAGHNKSFSKHLFRLFKAKLPVLHKFQLILHGLFYFIGPSVVLLLGVISIYLCLQLPKMAIEVTLAASMGLSAFLSLKLARNSRNYWIDGLVALAVVFPLLLDLLPIYYRLTDNELYHFIISFPFAKELAPVQIFLLLAPFLVTLVGNRRLGTIRWIEVGYLVASYPIFLFLDIYATTLGFFDFILKKSVWLPTSRDASVEQSIVPEAVRVRAGRDRHVARPFLKYLLVSVVVFFSILANDLLVNPNCGEPRVFLYEPIFFQRQASTTIQYENLQNQIDEDHFDSNLKVSVHQESENNLLLQYIIDGKILKTERFSDISHVFNFSVPQEFGWGKKALSIKLSGPGVTCERTSWLSQRMLALRGQDLFINGEPFLFKGIVPSFSTSRVSLSFETGFSQIKSAGANVVRFYHQPSDEARNAAEKFHLLLIDQPDDSTWNNEHVAWVSGQKRLLRRFNKLDAELKGFPFTLFHNLGNELEFGLGSPVGRIAGVVDMISAIQSNQDLDPIFSYSTYQGYRNYPTPILGVNMLDTGDTYWVKNLSLMRAFQKPFYASEFGGFVARYEKPTSVLRALRIRKYWNDLIDAGAMGGVFFQSHDNWAQPIFGAINDPSTPDQPDDERGIWNEQNQAKLELSYVEEIFSDFKAIASPESLTSAQKEIEVALKNIRRYALSSVSLDLCSSKTIELGHFNAGEVRKIKLPIECINHSQVRLSAHYTTHHGLKGTSIIQFFAPVRSELPAILSNDSIATEVNGNRWKGVFFGQEPLQIMLPSSWKYFRLNGTLYPVPERPVQIDLGGALSKPLSVQQSTDGHHWQLMDPTQIGPGQNRFRIRIPPRDGRERSLLLGGLGSDSFELESTHGHRATMPCHPYRELLLPLAEWESDHAEDLTFILDRNSTLYLDRSIDPAATRDIVITLDPPKIFAPYELAIEKAE